MNITHLAVDHDKAIRSERYRAKRRAKLAAVVARRAGCIFDVLHEADGSCCARQRWPITLARLVGPLVATLIGDDPGNITALMAEREPTITLVAGPESAP